MIDVLCIGHACLDMNVHVPTFPVENGKQETERLLESGGGPAANAACLLARWGVLTAFAGLVGDDLHGRQVIAEFQSDHVDLSLLEVRSGHFTPLSVVIVNEQNGSRTIINRKRAQSFLDSQCLDQTRLETGILHFDGHEPAASLAALARYPQAISVLDAGSLREGTRILAEKVDYLVSSERFALAVTGLSNLDDAAQQDQCLALLRQISPGQVVVTMGERGLIYDDHGKTGYLPADLVKTVDTTAAGDIFHGAFVYGLLQKWPLVEILQMASRTAALSVQTKGGRQSIPALETVMKAT